MSGSSVFVAVGFSSHQESPHGGASVLHSLRGRRTGPDDSHRPQPGDGSSRPGHGVSLWTADALRGFWRWWTLNMELSHRLDSAVLSRDTLLSVHVGDRILEVNGIPVRNITAEEVGLLMKRAVRVDPATGGLTPSPFLQINCVIQDTTKPLQLTIEHNPQSPDDPPGSNHPLHSSSSTDGPEKLGPTHKLPSLEEEPNAGQENEPIRVSPSPTQSRRSLGVRSRHVM